MSEPKRQRTREEVAKIEIGHTAISRRLAWALIALFVGTIFAVPIGQQVYEVRRAVAQRPGLSWSRAGAYLPRCYDIFRSVPRAWRAVRDGGGAVDDAGVAGLFRRVKRANDRVLLPDIQQYTDALKDDSLLTDALLPPAQRALSAHLGVGNEQAYLGRDGWLFYRPGVDYVTGPGFLSARHLRARRDAVKEWQDAPGLDPVGTIVDFARQLEARGVRLVLLPTPVKPMIHPERLSARFEDCFTVLQNPSFDEFRRRLDEAGTAPDGTSLIAAVDPGPAMVEQKFGGREPWKVPEHVRRKFGGMEVWPLYLRTDTHWRPEAMNVVAFTLSLSVRKCLAAGGADPEGRERYTEVGGQATNMGDIAAMVQPLVKSSVLRGIHGAIRSAAADLGLDGLAESWATDRQEMYPPETVPLRRVLDALGNPWRPDRDADVLLLGDSFSNIYSSGEMGWGDSAGLAERLSYYLRRPVDAIVRNDAGSYATRQRLAEELRAGRDRLAGKRVVVWQFAIRELAVGDWKRIELKLGPARARPAATQLTPGAATKVLALAKGASAVVTGRIAALKLSPKPGTVPYKDHIMPVHLVDVATPDGTVRGAEAVVLMWGLRDNRSTGAMQLRPGQRITVRIRPWQDVEAKYGTINTDELDHVDLDVDRYWCEELK